MYIKELFIIVMQITISQDKIFENVRLVLFDLWSPRNIKVKYIKYYILENTYYYNMFRDLYYSHK